MDPTRELREVLEQVEQDLLPIGARIWATGALETTKSILETMASMYERNADVPSERQAMALWNIHDAACRWLGRKPEEYEDPTSQAWDVALGGRAGGTRWGRFGSSDLAEERVEYPAVDAAMKARFEDEMRTLYRETMRIYGYNARYFFDLLEEEGGLAAAYKLAGTRNHHEGLTKLFELGALDLSVEALVLREPWCRMFDERTLAAARKKLADLNYSE